MSKRRIIQKLPHAVLIMAVLAVAIAAASAANAQTAGPSMTVTPQSGVRPLTVVVKGTPCVTTKPPVGTAPHQIRISWQAVDQPWTAQTILIPDGQNAEPWTTNLVIDGFDLGVYTIEASCFSPSGQLVLEYPDQKVEVVARPPVLTGSPTSILVGESLTASATQCPDPDGPILGGGYFVRFTLEYLIPPSGTEGPFSESTTVWTDTAGVASTIFALPANAPTEGGAYRLSASCQLEEFGAIQLFSYTPVAIQVAAQPAPTPTPTPQPTATAVPTPQPTATPAPTPTPGPTSTPAPQPTATAAPTSTPAPTPTPRPGGGGVIIFTG